MPFRHRETAVESSVDVSMLAITIECHSRPLASADGQTLRLGRECDLPLQIDRRPRNARLGSGRKDVMMGDVNATDLVPLHEAAPRLGYGTDELRALLRSGEISGVYVPDAGGLVRPSR